LRGGSVLKKGVDIYPWPCDGLNPRRVLVLGTGDVFQGLVSAVARETKRTIKNEESLLSSSFLLFRFVLLVPR
jgi:hypothetical protein